MPGGVGRDQAGALRRVRAHRHGTCTVTFKDRDGSVDPTTHDWISRPLAFAVRNPVTDTWHPRFRGHIEDHGYDLHPSRFVGEVVLEAADALSYFAGFELAPGACRRDGDLSRTPLPVRTSPATSSTKTLP